MINRVTLEESTYKSGVARFEAGTPNVAGAIGLAAAIAYLDGIGLDLIHQRDTELTRYAVERLREIPGLEILGPQEPRGALVGFLMDGIHPHDLVTFADTRGLALRGGHHCTQPIMRHYRIPGTNRASFYFYNDTGEIDRMIDILQEARNFFGA
jgi:cysteine desulfurase/selenocysteine lyase